MRRTIMPSSSRNASTIEDDDNCHPPSGALTIHKFGRSDTGKDLQGFVCGNRTPGIAAASTMNSVSTHLTPCFAVW